MSQNHWLYRLTPSLKAFCVRSKAPALNCCGSRPSTGVGATPGRARQQITTTHAAAEKALDRSMLLTFNQFANVLHIAALLQSTRTHLYAYVPLFHQMHAPDAFGALLLCKSSKTGQDAGQRMMFKLLQNVSAGSSHKCGGFKKLQKSQSPQPIPRPDTDIREHYSFNYFFNFLRGSSRLASIIKYSCCFSLQQASSLDEPLKCTSATALSHGVRSLLPLARILPDTPSHCYSAPSTLTARRPTPYPCTFRPHMPFRQASSEASEKIGNIQRRLAWPPRRDDMITREGD